MVDDLNNLAGQIHAISEQPTITPDMLKQKEQKQQQQQHRPQPQRSQSTTIPYQQSKSATIDRKMGTKNKRRAPAPPSRVDSAMRRTQSMDVIEPDNRSTTNTNKNGVVNGDGDSLYTEIREFAKPGASSKPKVVRANPWGSVIIFAYQYFGSSFHRI